MADIAMIVSNRYDPDPRVHREARSLVRAGHQVTVYAFDRLHEIECEDEILEGVKVRRLRLSRKVSGGVPSLALGLRSFYRAVRSRLLGEPPNAVHCHDQDTCPVGYWWQRRGAAEAGKAARGSFVFDAHDLYWTWLLAPAPDSHLRHLGALALRVRDRWYASAADLLITVTEGSSHNPGTAEIYRAWNLDPVVIWNAPDPVVCPAPMPERFTVGYLGSVREAAMFEWLIDAIALLPAGRRPAVKLAGHGRLHPQVSSLLTVAGNDLGFPVEIGASFTHEQLATLMSGISLTYCLYPSARGNIQRSMPVKLLESVAHGRPVIGNAGTLMDEWITRHDWGWTVPEADPSALARVLDTAGNELGRSPSLSPPPYWDEQAEVLISAYDRLLNSMSGIR